PMSTITLAMAFAGNDLVNFIGVPLAGYSSYVDYSAHGAGNPSAFMMDSLNGSAKTPFLFLFAAGMIMVWSLATSKKARNVVKTSVDLSRQDEGEEMFGSSRVARSMVRSFNNVGELVVRVVPQGVRRWIDSRFCKDEVIMEQGAAFDLVRASVNIVLAGLLIIIGTSFKLPLSTTYVTFIVAMGTSLADRAWSRESAVFRITGMLSVIGGWFITAGAAFIAAGTVVLLMHFGGIVVMTTFIVLALVLLVKNNMPGEAKDVITPDEEVFRQMMQTQD
ncbi:inorganic phosphate transporter, partial [Parabacteroides distasonis]